MNFATFLFAAENDYDDPLCRLTVDQRIRVCTLVFSSAHFDGELDFLPNSSNIDESLCIKKNVSFRSETSIAEDSRRQHGEWMIRCKPKEYFFAYKSEYFLSRAYASNDVYAYHSSNGEGIFLENVFTNIRLRFQ